MDFDLGFVNAHGDLFQTFLKDNRAIILNGRITPQLNNFTFVSPRGLSVPDYVFCPIDHMSYCHRMETVLIKNLINELNIPPPPSIPDHSILSGLFVASYFKTKRYDIDKRISKLPDLSFSIGNLKPPKKNLKRIDKTFFMSQEVYYAIQNTITRIVNVQNNQLEINSLWAEIKSLFLTEMESLPNLPSGESKKIKKSFRKSRPFWNQDLAALWSNACKTEKAYLGFKAINQTDKNRKSQFRDLFKSAQRAFDKKYRIFKRQHESKNISIIYDLAKNKSPNLWEHIKKQAGAELGQAQPQLGLCICWMAIVEELKLWLSLTIRGLFRLLPNRRPAYFL